MVTNFQDVICDFLRQQGAEYKVEGDEVRVKQCFYCGKDGFKINLHKGLFYCNHRNGCAQQGHFLELQR